MGPTPWTPLWVWLARLGVRMSHGRAYHPQTQGKVERFHRTLRAEVLTPPTTSASAASLRDLVQAQAVFDAWLQVYNHERPHEALALAVPATRYQPSPRPFPDALPPVVYDPAFPVRRVQQHGEFSWRGRCYRLSKAFAGHLVGLRPTDEVGCFAIYFLDHCLASLDTRSGSVYPVVTVSRV